MVAIGIGTMLHRALIFFILPSKSSEPFLGGGATLGRRKTTLLSSLMDAQVDLEITNGEGESSMASRQEGGSSAYEPRPSTQAIRAFVGGSEDLIAIPEVVIRGFVASDDLQSLANRTLRMRRKMAKGGQKQQVVDSLPVELLERIFCRIPFPAVFKVRLLAKEWLHKFPAPSLESLDPYFPSLISSMSSDWNKYCPVISTGNNSLLCFDQTSFQWRRMPMFSNLPQFFHASISESKSDVTCTYAFSGSMQCFYRSHYVMVCNTITKDWKKLPELPKYPSARKQSNYLPSIQMLAVNSDTYKIVLVYTNPPRVYYAFQRAISHIYDSKSEIWMEVISDEYSILNGRISTVNIDGRLYWYQSQAPDISFVDKTEHGIALRLEPYLVEDDSWLKTIFLDMPWPRSFADKIEHILDLNRLAGRVINMKIENCAIFNCKDKVVMVAWFHDYEIDDLYGEMSPLSSKPDSIWIGLHECDFEKKRKLVLDWPQPTDDQSDFYKYLTNPFGHRSLDFSADDNFIYVVSHEPSPDNRSLIFHVLLAYHLDTRTWTQIPLPPRHYRLEFLRGLAFQPGLYPFMPV